jgi:dTDP-4-amino-4,6-dideoxygalactose transaminase
LTTASHYLAPHPARRKVPLLDLTAQHGPLRDVILAELTRLIDAQQFILGAAVSDFERDVAAYCGARFAIGCASGSDALLLALMAAGVGPGDQVLTVPFTFFATAGAIARLGAVPVFCDIDARTFNMDPAAAAGAMKQHPGVKAIIPVHLYGAPAAMDELNALAAQYGAVMIEDAAQAIGAEYKGRRVGSAGAAADASMACFSFFPTKNLGAYGDAGLVTTNDEAVAKRLAALRVHGSSERYYHHSVGVNSRIDALQAAVLRLKLPSLDGWTAGRQRNAGLYNAAFAARGALVTPPAVDGATTRHVYNQYVIRAPQRDDLRQHLASFGIGSEVYYPLPLHLQECFAYLGQGEGAFPVSEQAAREVLALPVYPELPADDIHYVADAIAQFYC